MNTDTLDNLAAIAIDAVVSAHRDGAITLDELEEHMHDIADVVYDGLALQITPAMSIVVAGSATLAITALRELVELLGEATKPSPKRIRARASRARARGHDRIADRREARAARVEDRQS